MQNGNYAGALQTAGAGTGQAVGGQIGQQIALGTQTAGNMVQSGLDQNWGNMVNQGFTGTGQIMTNQNVAAGTQVQNMA